PCRGRLLTVPSKSNIDSRFSTSTASNVKPVIKLLAGSSFYNIENNPTCGECYNKTLENCHKCHQKITDRLLRARGGVWHVNCFTCESCKKSLDGVPFTSDPENNVYCVGCYQE
ncbi:LIM domain protein, partial [Cooperia oncophora]